MTNNMIGEQPGAIIYTNEDPMAATEAVGVWMTNAKEQLDGNDYLAMEGWTEDQKKAVYLRITGAIRAEQPGICESQPFNDTTFAGFSAEFTNALIPVHRKWTEVNPSLALRKTSANLHKAMDSWMKHLKQATLPNLLEESDETGEPIEKDGVSKIEGLEEKARKDMFFNLNKTIKGSAPRKTNLHPLNIP